MKKQRLCNLRLRPIAAVAAILALSLHLLPGNTWQGTHSKAAEYQLAGAVTSRDGTVTWNCVYFGNYWQKDTNGDGKTDKNDEKQPIKWRVLSVEGDDAFLLADQNLDRKRYNETRKEVTWETCTLRSWLNSDFYQEAFSSEEQNAILTTTVTNHDNPAYRTSGGNTTQDKIFLLSLEEAANPAYGFSQDFSELPAREADSTAYAVSGGKINYWWLRSPGISSLDAAHVTTGGSVLGSGQYIRNEHHGIRPVLHLNLSAGTTVWKDAGKVTPITARQTNTSQVTAPAKVKKVTAKRKKKSIVLTWKKIKNVAGYQIQYAANKKFKKGKTRLVKKNKGKLTLKIKTKKICYFRVRAYRLNGDKKVYGKWSSRVKS